MKKRKVSAHIFPIFNLLNHMEFSHYKSTQCCTEGQAQVPSPVLPHSRSRSRHQNTHVVLPAQMPTPRRCWSHRYRMIMVKQSYFQGSLSKRFLNAYFISSLLHFISSLLTLGGRTGSLGESQAGGRGPSSDYPSKSPTCPSPGCLQDPQQLLCRGGFCPGFPFLLCKTNGEVNTLVEKLCLQPHDGSSAVK